MTTRGTIETISSGELSDSGRNFPHVLIQVPADALPTFTLGQNLFLIPAEITAGTGVSVTRDQAEAIIRGYAGDHGADYLPYAYRAALRMVHPAVRGGDCAAWDEVVRAARILGLRGA